MTKLVVDVILGVLFGVLGLVGAFYLLIKLYSCWDDRRRKLERDLWKASYTSNIRGNLIRTYSEPIESHYIVETDQELGKGGCGVVVIGQKRDTNELYAIKIVSRANTDRTRLERELKLLKDVDHANIVRLFSVYEDPMHSYFVMELCSGGHLGMLIARQPRKKLDEEWAKALCRQLISAVAHIHSRGIAHRDIKLQNILLDHGQDRTSQVKLIDFGYGSRYIGALPMRTKCGTPYTTAPEVLRECYDERCDVWSVGVVLYIMLSGKRPFEALEIPGKLAEAGKAAMITNILACRYNFNHSTFESVSKEAKLFVQTLLHPDYRYRIHSYEALENPWLKDIDNRNEALVNLSKTYKSAQAINNLKKAKDSTALQQSGMVALVFGLQPSAANDMRTVFQTFDSDGSGALSKVEFHKALSFLAPELTMEDINRLFHIVDLDNNGTISYTEFLAATLDPREIDIHEINEAFKLLDEDGNGFITTDEIKNMLTVRSERQHLEQLKAQNSSLGKFKSSFRLSVSSIGNTEPSSGPAETDVLSLDQRISDMMKSCDVDNDGVISYDEFIWAMTGAGRMFGEMPPCLSYSKSVDEAPYSINPKPPFDPDKSMIPEPASVFANEPLEQIGPEPGSLFVNKSPTPKNAKSKFFFSGNYSNIVEDENEDSSQGLPDFLRSTNNRVEMARTNSGNRVLPKFTNDGGVDTGESHSPLGLKSRSQISPRMSMKKVAPSGENDFDDQYRVFVANGQGNSFHTEVSDDGPSTRNNSADQPSVEMTNPPASMTLINNKQDNNNGVFASKFPVVDQNQDALCPIPEQHNEEMGSRSSSMNGSNANPEQFGKDDKTEITTASKKFKRPSFSDLSGNFRGGRGWNSGTSSFSDISNSNNPHGANENSSVGDHSSASKKSDSIISKLFVFRRNYEEDLDSSAHGVMISSPNSKV